MTDKTAIFHELDRVKNNLEDSLKSFSGGKDHAIDIVAMTVRTICNWSLEGGKASGYQSLLRQADLVTTIRFPISAKQFGCEIPGIRFFLLDGIELFYPNKKPLIKMSCFHFRSVDSRIVHNRNLDFSFHEIDFNGFVAGSKAGLQLLNLTPENLPDVGSVSTQIYAKWQTLTHTRRLKKKFAEWWTTEKVLRLNKKITRAKS